MIVPRFESGENVFEVLREKFNALADAVGQLDKLASASPLLDIIDTGAGKLIQWNGPDPEPPGAAAQSSAPADFTGAFAVKLTGETTARIYNGADPNGNYAGEIVIGSTHHSIPVGTVSIAAGEAADIYLTVHYDTSIPGLVCGFAKTLSNDVSGAQGWYRKLAHTNGDGTVTQLHPGGDIEIAGRWCE